MSRSRSAQSFSVVVNPKANTATPNPVCPKGANAELVFSLVSGYSWLSPYFAPQADTTDFGTPELQPDGTVKVTDKNGDNNLIKYTIYYQNSDGTPGKLDCDPEIQNSDSN